MKMKRPKQLERSGNIEQGKAHIRGLGFSKGHYWVLLGNCFFNVQKMGDRKSDCSV